MTVLVITGTENLAHFQTGSMIEFIEEKYYTEKYSDDLMLFHHQ